MKPYVHLRGFGQDVTIITHPTSSGTWPPTQATLLLASDTSLRDLTVVNSGAGQYNVALLAMEGVTRTVTADVNVKAQGNGTRNHAILLTGNGTGGRFQQVTALGENGSIENSGLFNYEGATATLQGGFFTGRGGDFARGIINIGSLEAESLSALGENGTSNYGLDNYSTARLDGGSFTGHSGDYTYGIYNDGSGANLETEGVNTLGLNGTTINKGLQNSNGATAVLRGGSFTGLGGGYATGISQFGSGSTLETESVTALGQGSTASNYGLHNYDGSDAYGIDNYGGEPRLEAENICVLAENGSAVSYGLRNDAEATLHGGSFTGRGDGNAAGINHLGNNAVLVIKSVTALGEGDGLTSGLFLNSGGAYVYADSSQFIGGYGLRQFSGYVRLGVSQLDGGANFTGGTLTCFQVYDGSYAAYACPQGSGL